MHNENATWSAWIDTMPPNQGGTLHVSGTIKAPKAKYDLVKSVPQGINPTILLLEIEPDPVAGGDNEEHELKYEEKLSDPHQYKQVEIKNPAVTIEITIVS